MSDDERHLFQQIIASFDTPAFMRRARDVEAVWNEVVMRCQRRYDELLEMPRLRLAQLDALSGHRLSELPELISGQVASGTLSARTALELQRLHETWQPQLQHSVAPAVTTSPLVTAVTVLAQSFLRFNSMWTRDLTRVDLADVNRMRADYNEYYLLEKECVVHSALIARMGYEPQKPATLADLQALFPLLPPVFSE